MRLSCIVYDWALCAVPGKLTACSLFDSIKIHSVDYDTMRDPSLGFLYQGVLFMAVKLQHIKVLPRCIRRTLREDMRLINVGLFSRHSITLRMDNGEALGLISKTKIRTTIYTANLLICQFLKYVRPIILFVSIHALVQLRSGC